MSLFDIVILALIQGVTEFLPISSSGHLALWPLLSGRPDQGLVMDVAVHLGTLVAVCIYFRKDIGRLIIGAIDILRGRFRTPDARLTWLIALATVPAVLAGLILKLTGGDLLLRNITVIGWATLLGGCLLWAADRFGSEQRAGQGWGLRDAVLMGLAQALALIPGTSRSGITMTMARALGFERTETARLSLLMAVPIIFAAGVLEITEVVRDGSPAFGTNLVLGALLSCIAALIALSIMMRMFAGRWTMMPFVIYRLLLGAVLLTIAYS